MDIVRLHSTNVSPAVVDLLLLGLSWWASFWLRFNFEIHEDYAELAWATLPWCLLGGASGLAIVGVYRQVWRYTSLPDLRQLALGVILGALFTAAAVLMQRLPSFPRSVLLLQPLVALILLGAVRAIWRTLAERKGAALSEARPMIVIGSLEHASDALRTLKGSLQWHPVGIVSPISSEKGRSLQDVRVLGSIDALADLARSLGVATALVASPAGSLERRAVMLKSSSAGVSLLTMPHADEWLAHGEARPRRVELEDLLGRDPVQLDVQGLSEMVSGQTVLVTGAGGSIGSELCRQIARFGVAKLVCVDVSEFNVYRLEQELRAAHPQMKGLYYTCNVREPDRLEAIARLHQPSSVFHAAAYKHVPLMEELNEIEALRTNVLGTLHSARTAGQYGAQRFVLVSTDKAVNPTNIMGASKRMAELVVQRVASQYSATQYVSVRFGNVLGSSGSVVPLFSEQIARGGPVTVTHPDIVRYFMTIPEAAQLVLQASLMGQSGQIFVLDMGEPMKIVELARLLIRLSGKTEQDIPISFTGLRPGEKLFEELLADDETSVPTPHPKLRVSKASAAPLDLAAVEQWLAQVGADPADGVVRAWLRSQVPEYAPTRAA